MRSDSIGRLEYSDILHCGEPEPVWQWYQDELENLMRSWI